MDNYRTERISEALKEELGELIGYELTDPRIGDTVITEVLVSPDMRHAQIRLHLNENGQQRKQETIEALSGARHFLRRQLAERLSMYRIPELHFEPDVAPAIGTRMDTLLKRVRRGRPRDAEASR